MKKPISPLVLLTIFCMSALALSIPKNSKYDERITFAGYNADDVVLIKCQVGFVSMIKFGDKERIVNIAAGFPDGWEIIDKENFLFIRPKAYAVNTQEQELIDENGKEIEFGGAMFMQPTPEEWQTNLIITTTERIYTFDLTLVESKEKRINYNVNFKYPNEDKKKQIAAEEAVKQALLNAKEKESIDTELNRVNVPRNWNFVMHVNKGSETIAPEFAYDDGVFTYLGFSTTKTIPSVFLFDEKNQESILNTHLKKNGNYDVLVIHKTAEKILLRSGDKLVGIFNQAYARNPLDRTYTTKSKNVVREIKEDER